MSILVCCISCSRELGGPEDRADRCYDCAVMETTEVELRRVESWARALEHIAQFVQARKERLH